MLNSTCLSICPKGYAVNITSKACVTLASNSTLIYFPHLITLILILVVLLIFKCFVRKSMYFAQLISFWGLIEWFSYFVQISLAAYESSWFVLAVTIIVVLLMYVQNTVFVILYLSAGLINTDQEFMNYKRKHYLYSKFQIMICLFG